MRDIPHFEENTPVTIEITEDGFTVKKAQQSINPLPLPNRNCLLV
jgi:antitoxin MazE